MYLQWGSKVEHRDLAWGGSMAVQSMFWVSSATLTGLHGKAEDVYEGLVVLLNRPLCLLAIEEDESGPSTAFRSLLEPALLLRIQVQKEQNGNKTKHCPPGPSLREQVVCSPSPEELLPPSLGRPSQAFLPFDFRQVWQGPRRAGQ